MRASLCKSRQALKSLRNVVVIVVVVEGSCDLIFDGVIFVIHILCYYRNLTRGSAGILNYQLRSLTEARLVCDWAF